MGNSDELSIEFGRVLTAEVVPEELPFFDELLKSRSATTSKRDHDLGFGGEEALIGIASVFLVDVAKTVISFLWDQLQAALGDLTKDALKEAQGQLNEKISSWIHRRFAGPPPISVSAAAAHELMEDIRADAISKGLKEPELRRLMTELSKALGQPALS
ncbi:hypothetical protein [Bradyrhizobium centrosematis]|uniref:hypothetical protein n=1 Tax=Bradyrhizobium centrosematis TaxID=1300039 RepID=UPI00216838CC|nr:hypothetical protein [Bradyrhizobium centrosematis]MCS3763174.1 hypothetical protein [Bradyrhizobium centrosematis]MCS3775841.1 hypothetical protein [Bradyrhizobium centrosematis]